MKTLRFFFLSLLAAFSFAVSAQTIEVYKDGRVIDSFAAASIDSVAVKELAKYYYYAGWDCPKTVEELESRGIEIENFEAMSVGTQIRLFDGELSHSFGQYSIVVPEKVGLYGSDGANRIEDTFDEPDRITIPGYLIYSDYGKWIEGIMLKKI